jgi:hypothetical protein
MVQRVRYALVDRGRDSGERRLPTGAAFRVPRAAVLAAKPMAQVCDVLSQLDDFHRQRLDRGGLGFVFHDLHCSGLALISSEAAGWRCEVSTLLEFINVVIAVLLDEPFDVFLLGDVVVNTSE